MINCVQITKMDTNTHTDTHDGRRWVGTLKTYKHRCFQRSVGIVGIKHTEAFTYMKFTLFSLERYKLHSHRLCCCVGLHYIHHLIPKHFLKHGASIDSRRKTRSKDAETELDVFVVLSRNVVSLNTQEQRSRAFIRLMVPMWWPSEAVQVLIRLRRPWGCEKKCLSTTTM